MSGYAFKNGATSVILQLQLYSSVLTATNGGLTGLSGSSTGLIIGTRCDTEATFTTYTQAGGTIQTIATLGTYAAPSAANCRFAQVDATNAPGLYELQLLNSRISVSGAKYITITVPAVAGLNLLQMAPLVIPLTAIDPYNAASALQAQSSENYTTAGSQGTYEGILNDIHQFLLQSTITGTAWQVYKQNGSTAAIGLTINNAATPTSIARTS